MKLTHLSLFSGIGGLDLAAEWAGIQTVGQCEWAEYPTKVLERHWPDVPRWKDIRTLTGESFYERTGRRTVDIISGGFPCQPFSVAGKQRGKEDDRYLWPEMVRVITELRPTWIIGENVAGIVRMALPDILSELEACGYRTRTFLIPACAVGARHRRYRVAIVGYSEHNGLSSAEITGGTQKTGEGQQEREKKTGKFTRTGKSRNYEYVANAYAERELQSAGNKQDIGNGIGNSCKTLANAESQFEGRLPIRTKPKKPGFIISGKNVQHTNGTGCKELYTTAESDKKRIAGRGCDEGNVCNTAGERFSDGSGEPLGGQGTQEQKSERSDCDVSYTDNRLRKRPDEKIQPGRDTAYCSGTGKRKRSAESVLGGVADGISSGLDRDLDIIIDYYWNIEPDIPRIATGVEHRVDRLKCLGNAVVPQQFYPVFEAIAKIEELN